MPPTNNDRSSNSPTCNWEPLHTRDILGIKASQMAASQRRVAYSGSDSSSDSSSNSASDPESSPSLPLTHSQLIELATLLTIAVSGELLTIISNKNFAVESCRFYKPLSQCINSFKAYCPSKPIVLLQILLGSRHANNGSGFEFR